MIEEATEYIHDKLVTSLTDVRIITDDISKAKQYLNRLVVDAQRDIIHIEEFVIPKTVDDNKVYIVAIISETTNYQKVIETFELSNCRFIFWDMSFSNYSRNIFELLDKVESNAIMTDYEVINFHNSFFLKLIKKDDQVRVRSTKGTNITFRVKSEGCAENCNFKDEHAFQLPGGEVFWIPQRGSCNGTICLEDKIILVKNDLIQNLDVISEINRIEDSNVPICEFGLGSNENVHYSPYLSFAEKAWGTCHFGNIYEDVDGILTNYTEFQNKSLNIADCIRMGCFGTFV